MGLLDKIKRKIGSAMEKSAVKQMSEEDREKYEKEKLKVSKPKESLPIIQSNFTKDELNNLEALLIRVGAVDNDKVWVSGFLKHRDNLNVRTANLFSGKKNMKFLTYNNGLFYMLGFDKDIIKSVQTFKQENVIKAENKKEFRLELNLKTNIRLVITDNKKKADELVLLLLNK